MAAIRFGLVTSAVRICPSTIWRRAAAASNMREVPDCGIGLCDTPRQNASGWFSSIIEARKALPNQLSAVTHAGTATWRSGYAAVCKTDYFSFKINMHSEKIEKFDLLPANRLAADSEYDPLQVRC